MIRSSLRLSAALALSLAVSPAFAQETKPAAAKPPLGYQDTPLIPGTKWHVHDGERPQPKVVTPGSWNQDKRVTDPPSDAIVLFDGRDLSKWKSGNGEAKWKVEEGYAEINKTGDIQTKGE